MTVLKDKRWYDILQEGARVPGDCGSPFEIKPYWYEDEKMEKALQIFHQYSSGIRLSHLLGTVLMSQVSSLMDVLLITGHHANLKSCVKRALTTTSYVHTFYKGDLWDPEDLGCKNLKKVRQMHLRAAKKSEKDRPRDDGFVWLSQLDMALTQFAFIGALVLDPVKLGVHCPEEDVHSFLYYWRVIGYLLGMEERFNICSRSYPEIKIVCQDILKEVVIPTFSKPVLLYSTVIENAFYGFEKIAPGVRFRPVYNFCCELMEREELKKEMSMSELWLLSTMKVVLSRMKYEFLRSFINRRSMERSPRLISKALAENELLSDHYNVIAKISYFEHFKDYLFSWLVAGWAMMKKDHDANIGSL